MRPPRIVLLAALVPLLGTDCPGATVCAPCPGPVRLLLSADAPIADVSLAITFSGSSQFTFNCDERADPVECRIYPNEPRGTDVSGHYAIGVSAPGFAEQTVEVDVAHADDNGRCACGYDQRTLPITLVVAP